MGPWEVRALQNTMGGKSFHKPFGAHFEAGRDYSSLFCMHLLSHIKFCSMELLAFQVFFVVAEIGANKLELIAKNCFLGCLNWAETEDPTPLP